jgi:hypothetical protein
LVAAVTTLAAPAQASTLTTTYHYPFYDITDALLARGLIRSGVRMAGRGCRPNMWRSRVVIGLQWLS